MAKFCKQCGGSLALTDKVCSNCGTPVVDAAATPATTPIENISTSPVASPDSVSAQSITTENQPSIGAAATMEKRSLVKLILLSIITLGIYAIYWQYTFTEDIHQMVGRKTTPNYILVLIYSIITLGIYGLIYLSKVCATLNEAKDIRQMESERLSDSTIIILAIVGALLFPPLMFFAQYKIIVAYNDIVIYDKEAVGMAA